MWPSIREGGLATKEERGLFWAGLERDQREKEREMGRFPNFFESNNAEI
jgi:hypothetical protein